MSDYNDRVRLVARTTRGVVWKQEELEDVKCSAMDYYRAMRVLKALDELDSEYGYEYTVVAVCGIWGYSQVLTDQWWETQQEAEDFLDVVKMETTHKEPKVVRRRKAGKVEEV